MNLTVMEDRWIQLQGMSGFSSQKSRYLDTHITYRLDFQKDKYICLLQSLLVTEPVINAHWSLLLSVPLS